MVLPTLCDLLLDRPFLLNVIIFLLYNRPFFCQMCYRHYTRLVSTISKLTPYVGGVHMGSISPPGIGHVQEDDGMWESPKGENVTHFLQSQHLILI